MNYAHSAQKQRAMSYEEAQRRFSYDPLTGLLVRISGQRAGSPAGGVTTRGYLHVYAFGHYFAAHRICWLLHFGEWPQGDLDHINHNKTDNRIENLRSVTIAENNANLPGGQGPKRYGWDRTKGRWRVRCKRNGRFWHGGYFKTEIEAATAAAAL